jgi:preprotein translocase subunit SecG
MEIIGVVLLVVFVIVCLLIVGLVLIQNEGGDSLGGLFAGGSNSAFGSRSASVLTKATYVVVGLFFVTAFFLAFINKSPSDKGLENAARLEQAQTNTEWWNNDTSKAATPADATAVPATDTGVVPSTTTPAAPASTTTTVPAPAAAQ